MAAKTDLADILLKRKLISKEEASQLKLESLNTASSIGEILRAKAKLPVKEIVSAEAELIKVPYIDLEGKEIKPRVLSLIPEMVAQQYVLIPVELKENVLEVAMKDPLDLQVLEFLSIKTGYRIKPFLASEEQIRALIKKAYSEGIEKQVRAALKETEKEAEKIETQIEKATKLEDVVRSAPVARIVSTILDYAIKSKASDIHIEPQEEKTRVRYRIDGVLRERLVLPKKVHEAVVSRIKILSNLKIDEKRVPQDGRFMATFEGAEVDLRVSTLPTSHGEKVVLRLLRKSGAVPSLSDLGLRGRALKTFEESLKKTRGIILVTGPTGSGKTTTLRTALSMINRVEVNIITLEDPVEYEIAGINQVQINPNAGLTFASGLRSILRQDPNIIMVGEIRDKETMELAIQAALTGHLVFSTVHTNSAAGTLPRLLDMGAEPFLLSSTLDLTMAQRLVRTLCGACKKSYSADSRLVAQIRQVLGSLYPKKEGEKLVLYKAVGCKECEQTGYVSRIGIYEVLPVTEKTGRLILERQSAAVIEKNAVEEGMVKMVQDGYLKVIEGLTTIEEVLRVAQE